MFRNRIPLVDAAAAATHLNEILSTKKKINSFKVGDGKAVNKKVRTFINAAHVLYSNT